MSFEEGRCHRFLEQLPVLPEKAARDAKRSGMGDDEWWYSVLPVLNRVLADRDYPVASRVGSAIAAPHSDQEYSFAFGLARILDGIELLVSSRSNPSSE